MTAAGAPSMVAPRAPARAGILTELLSTRALLLGGVMVVIWSLFATAEQDPDFWWHIRIGRWMTENMRLPSTDIFTYTVSSHAWTDHEYLTEILMWVVYNATGTIGIALAFALVTWLGFWLMYRQVRRQPYVIVGVGLALAAVAGNPIWGPRAQMVTFALSCLELFWLQGYLSGRSRALLYFPLVMAIWANLHGGWVIAFAWLGIAIAAEAVMWVLDRANPAHWAHLKFLAIVTVASGIAVAATPHGFSLYSYPFNTVGSVAQEKLIVEWFSPDFHQRYLLPFEAMIVITIGGFGLRRPSMYEFLLFVVSLGFALQSVRNVALFVAATTPVMINTYGAWWKEFAASRSWKLESPPARPAFAAVTALALVVITGATLIHVAADINSSKQASIDASTYPVAAADWLAAHPEVGTRMYNQYGWGGYLANRFYPQTNRRVFIFGEAALMGDDLLNQYEDVQTLRPEWQQILDRYGVDYIVYNRGEALDNVLRTSPQWKLVYEDSVSVIYVRVAPA